MNLIRYIAVILICLLLFVGCSEERKREAAKLERELLAQDSATADTTIPQPAESLAQGEMAAGDTMSPGVPSSSALSNNEDSTVPMTAAADAAPGDTTVAGSHGSTAAQFGEPAPDVNAVPEERLPAARTAMPPHPRGDSWTVQIASSPSRTYADSMVNVFSSRGFEAYIAVVTANGRDLFRIRVGHFATSAEADAARQKLVDTYGLEPWIDHVSE